MNNNLPALPDPEALKTSIADVLNAAANVTAVTSEQEYESAGAILGAVKGRMKELDDQRKRITRPIDDAKKAAMDLFRPVVVALTDAEDALKRRMASYAAAQKAEREALEAKLNASIPASVFKPTADGVSSREVWRAEVTDFPALVTYAFESGQLDLLKPDMAFIDAIAKDCKQTFAIPGVTVRCETIIASRSIK